MNEIVRSERDTPKEEQQYTAEIFIVIREKLYENNNIGRLFEGDL